MKKSPYSKANSATLAEIFLHKYKFHTTFLSTITTTINNHHTCPQENVGHLMQLLNDSDAAARKKETEFFVPKQIKVEE
ncbi:MAG: hypothetical protein IBX44_01795 [Sulfurospirillum sp.]|nr:hypothetical protein [Sulfurospirillum sp.]